MSVRKNWKASYKGWITLSLSLTWFYSCVSATDISFHFTLPKEGDLIGPVVGATPPLINQLKQTLRHSTPIGEWHHTGSPKAKEHNTVLVIIFFSLLQRSALFLKSLMQWVMSLQTWWWPAAISFWVEVAVTQLTKVTGSWAWGWSWWRPLRRAARSVSACRVRTPSTLFVKKCLAAARSAMHFFPQSRRHQKRMDLSPRLRPFPRL